MPDPSDNGTKICSKCAQEKPHIHFGINRASPDGLQYACRPCRSGTEKVRRARKTPGRPKIESAASWAERVREKNRRRQAAPKERGKGEDLAVGLSHGIPLDRSEDLLRLAEEVATRPAGYPDDWSVTLARDLAEYND